MTNLDTKTNKKSRRNILIHFCATEGEATLIRQRKIDSGMVSLSAYIRKMAINGYHINLDLTDVRDMVRLLSNVTNNITQLSRRANEIQSVYADDVEDLRQKYNSLWDAANGILKGLSKIK